MNRGERVERRDRLRRFIKVGLEDGDSSVVDEVWGDLKTTRKWGDDFESKRAFKQWIEQTPDRYGDLSFDIEAILVDDKYGSARCHVSGETTGGQYDIVPTGQEFDIPLSVQAVYDDSGLLVSARTDFDFLEMLPESSRYARVSFVNNAGDAVVATDEDRVITEINEPAVTAFAPGRPRPEVLGTRLDRLIPVDASLPARGETSEIDGVDGRLYEATASPIENTWGEAIGQLFVFRDVTDRRQRVQQLQVLSRVLRHNIRNDLNVVVGRVESAVEQTTDESVRSELSAARQQAQSLLETAETAREVQSVIGQTTRRRRDLVVAVQSAVEQFHQTHPNAGIDIAMPDRLLVKVTDPLVDALYELIENAWEHGGTTPRIRIETDADRAVVSIHDDGPGFPDRELVVMEGGQETQLKHGSGLGLWFVRWVVTASNGELSVACDDSGSVVTVRLPRATPSPVGGSGEQGTETTPERTNATSDDDTTASQ